MKTVITFLCFGVFWQLWCGET